MTSLPLLTPEQLPRPGERALAVRIIPAAERALREGHPWLFESSIRQVKGDPRAGDPAVVFDRKNRFLAAGIWDPEGPIRVRLLVHGQPARIGEALFRIRVDAAFALRRPLLEGPDTTGIRLIYGESDGFPGVVVDRYGTALVVKLYSVAWIPHLTALLPALVDAHTGVAGAPPSGVLVLASRRVAASPLALPAFRGAALLSGALEEPVPFLERGLRFEAHPLSGHKTGFYLDQRENRGRLEERSRGARVLNVFSYTGGFSVAAARGGASEVTSLDVSAPALAQARRHMELNAHHPAVAAARHHLLEADAFAGMEALAREKRRFQVVVVDPPSFAKEAKQVPGALAQYGRLARLALRLLTPGGLLVQASCSSRVPAEDFFQQIHQSARDAGRPLTEVERTGHPLDHPIRWPESAYLKALWARAP